MEASGNSSVVIPEFLAISDQNNFDLPNDVTWKSINLANDELVIYITPNGETRIVTSSPFNDNTYYKITIMDYSI